MMRYPIDVQAPEKIQEMKKRTLCATSKYPRTVAITRRASRSSSGIGEGGGGDDTPLPGWGLGGLDHMGGICTLLGSSGVYA